MVNGKKINLETDEFLTILREISENPQVTQRELSSRVGLSLGKINFLIKAMVNKGFVKAVNFKNSKNKMVYLYFLTPSGIEETARVTCRFLKRKTEEYEKLAQEIRQLEKEVNSMQASAE